MGGSRGADWTGYGWLAEEERNRRKTEKKREKKKKGGGDFRREGGRKRRGKADWRGLSGQRNLRGMNTIDLSFSSTFFLVFMHFFAAVSSSLSLLGHGHYWLCVHLLLFL